MGKILITPRSLTRERHPAFAMLEDAGHEIVTATPGAKPDEDELIKLLPGCIGYLAGVEKISARVLEAAKDLKVISRNGTGTDSVDLDKAEELGIKVCTTPGANSRGVAELTVGMIFALLRSIPFSDRKMKSQEWARRKGMEVEGKTLGLVGCGAIGQKVARMTVPMGMTVLGYGEPPDESFALDGFRWSSLEGLFAESDIVSLHCPAGPKPLIDEAAISSMKEGAYLVNTARAAIVDEKAVLAALESGYLSGYGADVFTGEPPDDYTLPKNDKVVATPHIGGFTEESVERATVWAIENILENI
ncbi:MAG: phosphoglycerate dehydrogenase [Spirochaetota bacterium]